MLLSQLHSSQPWILPSRVPRLNRVSSSRRISMPGHFWWIKDSAIHACSSVIHNGGKWGASSPSTGDRVDSTMHINVSDDLNAKFFRMDSNNDFQVPVASLSDVQVVHKQSKRDQFLMKLCLEFGVTHSNLMNRDPSPSLEVCFGELLCEEQHLLTQATFQQDSNRNPVAYAAYGKGKGKDMHKVQCFSCGEYVILPTTVPRNLATNVINRVTLSKNVPLGLRIVKLPPIRLQ